jgi:hypothetical protein
MWTIDAHGDYDGSIIGKCITGACRRPRMDLHPCARDALDMIALNGNP